VRWAGMGIGQAPPRKGISETCRRDGPAGAQAHTAGSSRRRGVGSGCNGDHQGETCSVGKRLRVVGPGSVRIEELRGKGCWCMGLLQKHKSPIANRRYCVARWSHRPTMQRAKPQWGRPKPDHRTAVPLLRFAVERKKVAKSTNARGLGQSGTKRAGCCLSLGSLALAHSC
jgi:hypothetical protein